MTLTSVRRWVMIVTIETPFGTFDYNVDNLWEGLSQMGWSDVE
jgi:hypothetical protein